MIKEDFVQYLVKKSFQDDSTARQYVNWLLDFFRETLISGEQIKIRGIGTFSVKDRNGRRLRNFRTNETVTVEPYKAVCFNPSQKLKKLINNKGK